MSKVKAQIVGIQQRPSKFGGIFYYVFFKDIDNSRSYRTCVYPNYRNFRNWKHIIESWSEHTTITLDNLIVRNGIMVDADSVPTIVEIDNGGE